MAPDTQQNLIYTVYFILIHNFEALLYSLGIAVMTIWALWRPSRSKILILWGFILLLFAFEYKKHIVEGLREQTVNSLVTVRESWRIERYIDIILVKLVPLALPLMGWTLIIGGFILKKTKWDTEAIPFPFERKK